MDYALEEQLALQKMKEAQALRGSRAAPGSGKNTGGWYQPNIGGIVQSVIDRTQGNRMEDQATTRMRELSDQQDAEVSAYNKAVSTPGTMLKQALRQGEGPLMQPNIDEVQAPLSPEQENQRQMELSLGAMRLPKARAAATQFVNSGVGFPEKMAQLNMQQQQAREQQAARLQAQQEMAQQRIESQKERDSTNNALKMTLAGMRGQGSVNADLDRQIKELTLEEKRRKMDAGPKPTAAEVKEQSATKKALATGDRLEGLINEADANKGAFGVVPAVASMLPNAIGSRMTSKALSEKEQVVRAKVMTEGAKVIHELYGAALSRGEGSRANSWAPNPNDDYDTIVRKMKAAKEYSNSIGGQGKAPAAPSPSPAAVEEWVRDANGKLVRK